MSTLKIKRENGKIFCPLADSWHIETPEEKVRQEYIKILVEDYGYSLDQMAQEIKVNNSQRGQGKARADIVIWKSKQDKIESKAAFIVVECKAENVRIREEDYYQGYNYASWAGASFFVTTNEKETKYFNVDKDYLPKELVEVVAIPTAEEALNDKKVKDILSIPCSQSAGRGIFISSSLESTDLLDIATAASWLRPYLCVVQMCNCFLSSDEGRNSLSISNQALNRYWSTVIIPLGLHIHNEACDAFAFKLRIALCAKSIAYFLFIINVIVFHSQGKLMILKIKNPALKGKINQYA